MGNRFRFTVLVCLLGGLISVNLAAQSKTLVCGLALGYPPYQFTTDKGEPTGIDAEVTRLVFQELGKPFQFKQTKWDDVYLALLHNTGAVDLLCGAEINAERQTFFDFSQPYYERSVVIFVKSGSSYQQIDNLGGKMITGDRGGFIETQIDKKKMRMVDAKSKEEAFKKLQTGEVEAVIAPQEVGNWICMQLGLSVRTLPEKDPGSPVAFAVAKGNKALADQISGALAKLKKAGAIDAVMKKYK